MAEQVTTMVLKVDLECSKCRKKVDKVLGEFCGKIRERVYDEKKGTVTIKVVCCSPKKIKEELLRKGGVSIKLIEVVVPKPKDPDQKPKQQPGKPKEAADKPKEAADKPKEPVRVCCQQCFLWYPGHGGPHCPCHLGLCILCCGGLPFHGHCGPPPCCPYGRYVNWPRPGICSCGCGGSNCAGRCQEINPSGCTSHGCGRSNCGGRCQDYFCEEDPSTCTIM